jgi:hypothetical protein
VAKDVGLSAGTNLCGMYCIAYLYCNVSQDRIFLESLEKFEEYGRLDIAHFVVERLFRLASFGLALLFMEGDKNLKEFTESTMVAKFFPSQDADVTDVATVSAGGRSPSVDSTASISVQGYPVLLQSDTFKRQEFQYETPMFDSQTKLQSVNLFLVCHDQVSSDVFKYFIDF